MYDGLLPNATKAKTLNPFEACPQRYPFICCKKKNKYSRIWLGENELMWTKLIETFELEEKVHIFIHFILDYYYLSKKCN